MTAFFQAVAGVLIAVVLCMVLSRQGKEIAIPLSIAVCCMVLAVGVKYLEPLMTLIHSLQQLSNLDESLLQVILKAVGVGLIAQLASLICSDSGNAALGKTLEILAAAAILWLTVPLITALLELIQQMAGDL